MVGLISFAARRDGSTSDIARLTEKAERVLDGDRTVDFSSEREDELGRLYEAVGDLVERLWDRDRSARENRNRLERERTYANELLDSLEDVFYVLDREGTLQRWNRSFSREMDRTASELAETNALEFIAPEDREDVAEAIEETFETGRSRIEASYLAEDGTRVPYEYVATSLEDPDGNPILAGIGRDVRERRRRERDLERATDFLERTQRIAGVGGWELEVGGDGRPDDVFWTDEVYRIYELPRDAALDVEEALSYYHPEDRDRLRDAVERAIAAGNPFDLEASLETATGNRRWVRVIGEVVDGADDEPDESGPRRIQGSIQDVTDRVERERDLERTTTLLEQVQRLATVGGWELDLREEGNKDVTWTDELYRIHDLPRDVNAEMDVVLECYHPEDRDRIRRRLERALETETGYDVTGRIRIEDGPDRWVRAIGEPLHEDGDLVAFRGAVQDVTDRVERERDLESLHDAARGLLQTENEGAAADLVVETAEEVLDVTGIGIYLLDETTNQLVPGAHSAGLSEHAGPPEPVAVGGDEVLWHVFATGRQTYLDAGSPDDALFDETVGGLVVPVGDHGVFAVLAPPTRIGERERRVVETLVATAEAAFDRLESEASLRERDAELEERNQRLRRQVRLTEIIRSIDRSVIGSTSREEIERTVCERLVDREPIQFAWIGAPDVAGTELQARALAGPEREYLDAVSLELAESTTEPAVEAARTGRIAVVSNVLEGVKDEPWRTPALSHGFHSAVSVPLAYDEYSYGVLTAYADSPNDFAAGERAIFEELGEGIAHAITAVRTTQALHTDTRLELSIRLADSAAFLERLARRTGARVEYEDLTAHSADEAQLFFTASGVAPDAVAAALEDSVSVLDAHLVRATEDGCLFEATISGPVLAARLRRHGAHPRSISATDDGLEAVVDVPQTTDVREFLEMLAETHPSVELVARRTVERGDPPGSRPAALLEPLTDRQREVLRTAYLAGYFEWPRESTGEEVAEVLGISQPAVNRHLRLGQQRLLEGLFEAEPALPAGG